MKFEFSAGGVVFKKVEDKIFILVAQHSQHHGWVFPKGIIGGHPSTSSGQAKETKEEAALREVEEETGVIGKILEPLQPVTYWYNLEGDPSAGSGQEKIKKTVYYFLMEFVSGDTRNHDWEMENVEWIGEEEVLERLTYKSDKDVWVQAAVIINEIY
ncbi:MAG: NUDIX domain-containing protein [Patescibacteria group bacterium]